MEQLHQKQFDSLPEEKKYKGGRTVDKLLQDMAEGKNLNDAELEGKGISRDNIEGDARKDSKQQGCGRGRDRG